MKPIAERFWAKVEKRGPDECWLWNASTCSAMAYGQMGRGGAGAGTVMAHRVSYEMHYGPVPAGLLVCHRCDVPRCVNPTHLFLGTHLNNQRDMVAKGRSPRGERQGGSKLTELDVNKIRLSYPSSTMQKLADQYGVCIQSISNIINRKTWSHM